MAVYQHLPRSKKKKPDEFVSLVDHAVRWVSGHKGICITLTLIFVLGFSSFFYFKQSDEAFLVGFNEQIRKISEQPDKISAYQLLANRSKEMSWLAHLFILDGYLKNEKIDEALAEIEKAGEYLPSSFGPLLLWNKANILWQSGKMDDGLKLVDEVHNPFFNDYLLFLKGNMLLDQGKINEARAQFESLLLNEEAEKNPLLTKMVQERLVLLP